MMLLIFFAFLAGMVTILSPCVFSVLPILFSTIPGRETKAYGILIGFVFSFTLFTLIISYLVSQSGASTQSFRLFSVIILLVFGLTLVVEPLQRIFEYIVSPIVRHAPQYYSPSGLLGGFLIGCSLGLVWTPCIGPIMGSVISLAMMGEVTSSLIVITLAYALGTAIPMVLFINGGRKLFYRSKKYISLPVIRILFGLLTIATAIVIYTGFDKQFETYLAIKYPAYVRVLSNIENNPSVMEELDTLKGR